MLTTISSLDVTSPCSKFVEMGEAAHRAIASLRFLVQSRPVDDATFGTIMSAPANIRAAEVSFILGAVHPGSFMN
jgi:predicted nucleotidyltransferase